MLCSSGQEIWWKLQQLSAILIEFMWFWAGLLMEIATSLNNNLRFYTVLGMIIDGNCNTLQL